MVIHYLCLSLYALRINISVAEDTLAVGGVCHRRDGRLQLLEAPFYIC